MTTLFIHHPIYLEHDPNPGHPESPERLKAIEHAMAQENLPGLKAELAAPATTDDLLLAHSATYVGHVFAIMPKGRALEFLDADTALCAQSGEAALHAVGAVLQAVDAVIKGKVQNAFCAVRPPGHHAHRDHGAGFCLFNNVAIGAIAALQRHRLQRVAILDFDVHHGDGTQDIVWDNPDILLASTYQYPLYAGHIENEGIVGGTRNIINKSFPPDTAGHVVVEHWKNSILPEVEKFEPDLILVSAGYDAHADDFLAQLNFTTNDYTDLMKAIKSTAEKICEGRLVAVLEGGYALQALSQSVLTSLKVLSE